MDAAEQEKFIFLVAEAAAAEEGLHQVAFRIDSYRIDGEDVLDEDDSGFDENT